MGLFEILRKLVSGKTVVAQKLLFAGRVWTAVVAVQLDALNVRLPGENRDVARDNIGWVRAFEWLRPSRPRKRQYIAGCAWGLGNAAPQNSPKNNTSTDPRRCWMTEMRATSEDCDGRPRLITLIRRPMMDSMEHSSITWKSLIHVHPLFVENLGNVLQGIHRPVLRNFTCPLGVAGNNPDCYAIARPKLVPSLMRRKLPDRPRLRVATIHGHRICDRHGRAIPFEENRVTELAGLYRTGRLCLECPETHRSARPFSRNLFRNRP